MYKHYAKRMPIIMYAFGLFKEKKLIGACSYGVPVSKDLINNVFYGEYKKCIYELNRLVANDGLEKNVLSFFVSSTFKFLPNPCCLVSYADSSQGHHGYIYQATNWNYTGLSIPFKDWVEIGSNKHGRGIASLGIDYLRKHPEKYKEVDRSRKHRYFYFKGNKKDKKNMFKKFKYDILPYPKGDNKRYDASYNPSIQTELF